MTNALISYLTPFDPQNGLFPGSDGQGQWKKIGLRGVHLKFVKLLLDTPGFPPTHFGYLVVESDANIDGDTFTALTSSVQLCVPDLTSCQTIPSPSPSGTRLPF